jgi:hypothetical protein
MYHCFREIYLVAVTNKVYYLCNVKTGNLAAQTYVYRFASVLQAPFYLHRLSNALRDFLCLDLIQSL